jgi:hypothetical protein
MKLKWDNWFYNLLKSVIGGVAATGGAYIGTLVGNQITADIPVMNWKSLGFVVLFSSLSNLFFYLQKSPVPEESNTDIIVKPTVLPLLLLTGLLAFGLSGCAWLHPQDLKPVPVAAGQDSVVVNAERIQETSLFAYKELIEWEFQNRAFLAADVSRAVDNVRKEFPTQWRLSRKILSDYKAARGGDISDLNRINAALSAAQTAMLAFPGDNSDVPALFAAITSLSQSISTLKQP